MANTPEKTMAPDRELTALLRDYSVPEPDSGFYDRALARALHFGTRRQRKRWLAAGFGSAVAAGLAIWFVAGFFLANPDPQQAGTPIPAVTIALEEPHTVNLVFTSATALNAAMLTVSLPPGIELAGFPGQREITWETSLDAGKNMLPLTLVAVTPTGGELLARLRHDDRSRTFRVRVDIG